MINEEHFGFALFSISTKGKCLISINNYEYRKKNVKADTEYWYCTEKPCKTLLRLAFPSDEDDRPNILRAVGEHDHRPTPGKFVARFLVSQ